MPEIPSEPSSTIRLIRSNEEILRWNYPGISTLRSIDGQLLKAAPADPEVRARNRQRGSLFDALVDLIIAKLTDQPCYVELSGGCDSSLILSAATTACRRANHEPPRSVTFRFPGLPEMDERHYQDAVLDFLGLRAGHIFQITNEFDLLGPSAQKGLKIFGPVCPAPIFTHVDVLRTLEPGLLLSGEGGDEVLGARRIGGLNRAVGAAKRGQFRSVAGNVLNTLGPAGLRAQRFAQRNQTQEIDWIDPAEVKRFLDENFRWGIDEPLHPSKYPAHYVKSQTAKFAYHQLTEIRRWSNHQFYGPLMDPNFVQAVADLTPPWKVRHRTMVLNHHFSDNLPKLVLDRATKTVFQPAYFNTYAKEFARSWSGQISVPLVDGLKLKRYLLQEDVHQIHNPVFLLLQQAWLESQTTTSSQLSAG
jgi:asparagine synthetase B (glutamine-hydrolysing)